MNTKQREVSLQVVIDRRMWARTNAQCEEVNGAPRLMNERGGMCCLGFYCVQLHNTAAADLFQQSRPSDIGINNLRDVEVDVEVNLETALIYANDREGEGEEPSTDKAQEERIAFLFSLAGIEAVFIDTRPQVGCVGEAR